MTKKYALYLIEQEQDGEEFIMRIVDEDLDWLSDITKLFNANEEDSNIRTETQVLKDLFTEMFDGVVTEARDIVDGAKKAGLIDGDE
jgi:hypothetical protein